MDELQILRYSELEECLAAYLRCSTDELGEQEGVWVWADYGGERHERSIREAIDIIRDDDCWGWLEDKSVLHLWYSDGVTERSLLNMISHELGHRERPHHRTIEKEERKANQYAMISTTAYDIMQDLLREFLPEPQTHNQ